MANKQMFKLIDLIRDEQEKKEFAEDLIKSLQPSYTDFSKDEFDFKWNKDRQCWHYKMKYELQWHQLDESFNSSPEDILVNEVKTHYLDYPTICIHKDNVVVMNEVVDDCPTYGEITAKNCSFEVKHCDGIGPTGDGIEVVLPKTNECVWSKPFGNPTKYKM